MLFTSPCWLKRENNKGGVIDSFNNRNHLAIELRGDSDFCYSFINPLSTNVPLLIAPENIRCILIAPENIRWCFQGVYKWNIALKWINITLVGNWVTWIVPNTLKIS